MQLEYGLRRSMDVISQNVHEEMQALQKNIRRSKYQLREHVKRILPRRTFSREELELWAEATSTRPFEHARVGVSEDLSARWSKLQAEIKGSRTIFNRVRDTLGV